MSQLTDPLEGWKAIHGGTLEGQWPNKERRCFQFWPCPLFLEQEMRRKCHTSCIWWAHFWIGATRHFDPSFACCDCDRSSYYIQFILNVKLIISGRFESQLRFRLHHIWLLDHLTDWQPVSLATRWPRIHESSPPKHEECENSMIQQFADTLTLRNHLQHYIWLDHLTD